MFFADGESFDLSKPGLSVKQDGYIPLVFRFRVIQNKVILKKFSYWSSLKYSDEWGSFDIFGYVTNDLKSEEDKKSFVKFWENGGKIPV